MRRLLVTLFAILALLAPAAAEDARLGDLTIRQPWARASAGPAKAGAAYLAIVNEGASADRLTAAETPAARKAALHDHEMDGQGVMRMRPVEAIEVAPGETAVLKPGGLHVMLMGLAAPLKQGESFPLVLTFERAGSIEVEVRTGPAGAMGPGAP